ncbi:heterokaryon incompatibility protein-domain-containing protein [Rhypophila decipiens]|uniref:Heterokaryon incompatibility protein-domain-containing protein n=1 Tax=Rhypophila decipiens TaxID=261697 RepID=A0AAN7B744_9PEZI|nr:heterokaryon incompatibility protein-domain-containing protein [Rhypophila decipiens]
MSRPARGLNSVRVVVTRPKSQDGTEEERQTFDNVLVNSGGLLALWSQRPPEDVFKFGLPIGPDDGFQRVHRIRLTDPSERRITKDREDGLCIYCQLLLLEDAPEYAAHQPCMGLLIRNWDCCQLCQLINISIGRANPDWKARYEAGDMDIASPDTRIWVRSRRFERHSLVVATMGEEPDLGVQGTPIVWATSKSLGSLVGRMIWKSIFEVGQSDASARLDVIKEWLERCQSEHVACNNHPSSNDGNCPLPTRVLRISPRKGDLPFLIQLYEPDGESAPYIALSHCWGKSSPLKTTRSNLEQHKKEMAFEALPLTYRDVVAKAFYLGFSYLWIDSLCIVQDDSADWEAEAAHMAAVYSNATLTFAATEAADPSLGCCPQYTRAFPIPLEGDNQALVRFQDHLNLNSRDAALNKRGWTFQEAALSRRMVCFDNNQLLWKCCTRQESEDGLWAVTAATRRTRDWNLWACLPKLVGEDRAASYAFWCKMMEDYSNRTFSFEKDKLPALAGIVGALWGHSGIMSVMRRHSWASGKRTSSMGSSGAPASLEGSERLVMVRLFPDEPRLEVISAEVRWAGCPMTSAVSGTALKVNGRLKEATLRKDLGRNDFVYLYETNDESLDSCAPRDHRAEQTAVEPECLGYCHLDLVESMAVPAHVMCLEVYQGLQWRDTKAPRNRVHRVLVLEPVNEANSSFRRVGVGYMWQHSYRKIGTDQVAVKEIFSHLARHTISLL